jgi:hypothetical protein
MSAWSGLRALFGAPKPQKKAARPKQKTVLPPTERAALLKQALAAHRAGRTHVRDVLESQLDALRAKVPDPSRDPDAVAKLLTLTQADGALKKLMTHDLKRFLVLVGIRQLLGEKQKSPDRPRPVAKR